MFGLRSILGLGSSKKRLDSGWKYNAKGVISGSAVSSSNRIYIGSTIESQTGKLYCLSKNGDLIWKFSFDDWLQETPVIGNSRLFVGDSGGDFFCINSENGKQIWQFNPELKSRSGCGSPVLSGDQVLVGYTHGTLYSLRTDNGELNWKKGFGKTMSRPAINGNKIFLGVSGKKDQKGGKVYSLDRSSGQENWSWNSNEVLDSVKDLPPASELMSSAPLITKESVYIGSNSGFLYRLDKESGELIWKFNSGDSIETSPRKDGDKIYFGNNSGEFFCLNLKGELTWKFETEDDIIGIKSSASIADEGIYFGSSDNILYLLNQEGKMKWTFEAEDIIHSSPLVTSNKIVFGDFSGNIYCLSKNKIS